MTVTFPIRGHSYLECDKDFGLINQKSEVDVPQQWMEVFKNARCKPRPFDVVECKQDMFFAWTEFLATTYKKKCPFSTRPLREIRISHEHPRTIETIENYNGARQSFIIAGPNLTWKGFPKLLYKKAIPVPKKKIPSATEAKEIRC